METMPISVAAPNKVERSDHVERMCPTEIVHL